LDGWAIERKPAAYGRGKQCEGLRPLLKNFPYLRVVIEEQRREAREIVLLRSLCPGGELAQRIETERAKSIARQGRDAAASIKIE
jgi:hypothetical protein